MEEEVKKVYTPEEDEEDKQAMFSMLRECSVDDSRVKCVVEAMEYIPEGVKALCQPRVVLLTNPEGTCAPCEEAKKDFAEMMKAGLVVEKKIHLGDGRRIAEKNQIKEAPALLLVDCQDNVILDLG